MQHCQTQHTLLVSRLQSWSAAITAMNILLLQNVECGLHRGSKALGECHKYLPLTGFNGYALFGLCVCAAHGNRSKETLRSPRQGVLPSFYFIRRGRVSKMKRNVCVCVKIRTERERKNERERHMLGSFVCGVLRKQPHNDTVTSSSWCLLGLIYEISPLVNELEMKQHKLAWYTVISGVQH